jgi:hypothetical protein
LFSLLLVPHLADDIRVLPCALHFFQLQRPEHRR